MLKVIYLIAELLLFRNVRSCSINYGKFNIDVFKVDEEKEWKKRQVHYE